MELRIPMPIGTAYLGTSGVVPVDNDFIAAGVSVHIHNHFIAGDTPYYGATRPLFMPACDRFSSGPVTVGGEYIHMPINTICRGVQRPVPICGYCRKPRLQAPIATGFIGAEAQVPMNGNYRQYREPWFTDTEYRGLPEQVPIMFGYGVCTDGHCRSAQTPEVLNKILILRQGFSHEVNITEENSGAFQHEA